MRTLRTQRGYTLIEMLVTLMLSTLVLVTVVESVLYLYRANANTIEQAFALTSARRGTERLVRDIREASFSDTGAYPLISMDANELIFYSDIDRDNSIERVRYFLQGSNLILGQIEATGTPPVYDPNDEVLSVVSEDVRNTEQGVDIFEYYDVEGDAIADYAQIVEVRFITVTLIVNVNPSRMPNEFTLRSSATLRNLKTNL